MRYGTRLGEVITAFVCAVIGGLALATPVSRSWVRGTATLQTELLAASLPRAAAIGCLVAVVIAVFTSTAESLMAPWAATLCGMIVLLANHLFGRGFSETAPLTTLNYIDSLAGGLVLGGSVAAAAVRLSMILAFILGALSSVIVGDLTMSSGADGDTARYAPIAWFIIDSPSLWLLWPGTALVIWCGLRFRSGRRYLTISVELPIRPILAAVIGVSSPVLCAEWLMSKGHTTVEIVLVSGSAVLTALVVGGLLPGRDGVLIQLCAAISAIGGSIVLVPLSAWLVPVLIASMAVGLWYGLLRPYPVAAMAGMVMLAIFAVSAAGPQSAVPGAAIVATVTLSLLTGYSFGAALPGQSSSIMLALATFFVPGVVIAMRGRVFNADPDLILNNSTPGIAAVLITVGSACGLLLLGRRRIVIADPVPMPSSMVSGGV
ncbi:hypothetical protein [Nocardia sp. NPDC005366]|uniref:hypothetical protein n=1 Tax=Nocardia sp. NPDC005366 TaxID=3156878 RepID=UPI00339FDFA3